MLVDIVLPLANRAEQFSSDKVWRIVANYTLGRFIFCQCSLFLLLGNMLNCRLLQKNTGSKISKYINNFFKTYKTIPTRNYYAYIPSNVKSKFY